MKTAYFDAFAGASGDMILGALVDAGLSLDHLRTELSRLELSGYELQSRQVVKGGLGGTQVLVRVLTPQPPRHLAEIQALITNSSLAQPVKDKSLAIFNRLAAAEAKVHRTTVEAIHFHEVGAADAIVDIVGAVLGLEALGVEKVYCSPFQVGSGTVKCAHGLLPVPAPATMELVRGAPVYATGVPGELLTPTGAAILTTLAEGFGPLPTMTVEAVGYGAGSLDLPLPNLLRVIIGREPWTSRGQLTETVAVLETNIDDMNPQLYEHLSQRLLELGALEVFLTPVQMKKGRPGVLLTLICPPDLVETCAACLWRETTTIGLRWRLEHRLKLDREIKTVATRFGPLRVKIAYLEGRPHRITPEYEDCKQIALAQGIPLLQVLEEARAAIQALEQSDWPSPKQPSV